MLKFDRTLSITVILAAAATTMSIVWFLVNQDKRTTVLEQVQSQVIVQQAHTDTRQDAELKEARKQQREDYKEISNKLDKIMERLQK